MNEKLNEQIKVGIFVLIGLVLTAFSIFMLSNDEQFFEEQYRLKSYFSDVSGLRPGAGVYLAGINIGSVESVSFQEDLQKKKVEVVLKISDKYQKRILTNSKATVVTEGLLGEKAVLISMGTPGGTPEKASVKKLNDGDVIASESSGLFMKAESLLESLDKIASKVNSLLEGGGGEDAKKSLLEMIQSVNKIIKKVETGEGLIHALVYDPQGADFVKNLNRLSHNAADMFGPSKGRSLVKSIDKTLINISRASQDFRVIMARVKRGQGTIGALINDPSVFVELKTLLGKVNRNKIIRSVIRGTLNQKDKKLNK